MIYCCDMMKSPHKLFFIVVYFLSLVCVFADTTAWDAAQTAFLHAYSNNLPSENVYRMLETADSKRAERIKKQADAVAAFFRRVLKTEKQLIPKQCNAVVIYGYEGCSSTVLKQADGDIRRAVLANMGRSSMKVYVAVSDKYRTQFRNAVQKTGIANNRIITISAQSNRQAATAVVDALVEDAYTKKYNMENLFYRRVLLLTNACNTRTGYAAFIAALADNPYEFIFDDFSTLDTDRKTLSNPGSYEREAAFSELTQ